MVVNTLLTILFPNVTDMFYNLSSSFIFNKMGLWSLF